MATTLTPNLGLRVDSGLTANSKYNLNKIDTLGSSLTTDATATVVFRSKEDLIFRPHDASIGGDGLGGAISFGAAGQPLSSFNLFVDELSLDGVLSLADQATGGDSSLSLSYVSDLDTSLDAGANYVLAIDVGGADRELVLGGNFTLSGDVSITSSSPTVWTLPPDAGTSNYVLATDGAGVLSWAPAGSGTVTSVGLSLPSEFEVTGSPVSDAGTLTASFADQTQSRVFASPAGSTGTPTFRSLALTDLPALDTDDVAEGANLYYTQARFDSAIAAKTTADLAEGVNLYYTQARFDAAFTGKTTDDLTEGANLYYTDARARTASVADAIADGVTDIAPSQNAVFDALALKADSSVLPSDTDDLTEGAVNFYYTDARADARITAQKAQSNGLATLDGSGRLPSAQLPLTSTEYLGTWNAATNTPTLADGSGTQGDFYIVGTDGTQDLGSGSLDFVSGDWVLYNGSVWELSVNSDAVASVNGFTGVIVLDTDDVSEGANLYFTSARARTAAGQTFVAAWTTNATTSINHGLSTTDVLIEVYEVDSGETVAVDKVIRTDTNNVQLVSSEAPSGSGRRVVIRT